MHPYQQQPDTAFWRSAVSDKDPWSIAGLWRPLFCIDRDTRLVTVGSCFAQHIGSALEAAGYAWINAEPAPYFLDRAVHGRYGYGQFSFRTGNIYTPALLKQWLEWAVGKSVPPMESWERDGRLIDPFRPAIEPRGFRSLAELTALRDKTLQSIRNALDIADVWIFTLGLTEAWQNSTTGYWYPTCPGTVAGRFDASMHRFHNFSYPELLTDLMQIVAIVRSSNPTARFLFTVSPVPLAATASKNHVLVATEYSKSALRAVAEDMKQVLPGEIDYFPSFEIITSTPYRSMFYNANLRNVTPYGVEFVMRHFFSAIGAPSPGSRGAPASVDAARDADPACEDALLEAFGPAPT